MNYFMNLLLDGYKWDGNWHPGKSPAVNMTSPKGVYVSVEMLPLHRAWSRA